MSPCNNIDWDKSIELAAEQFGAGGPLDAAMDRLDRSSLPVISMEKNRRKRCRAASALPPTKVTEINVDYYSQQKKNPALGDRRRKIETTGGGVTGPPKNNF